MQRNTFAAMGLLGTVALVGLTGCGGSGPAATAPDATETASADDQTGTLLIRANGEDFVREGFTTKDGWEVSFDNVYVALVDIIAAQTDPPFDPEAGGELEAEAQVQVEGVKVIDLAEGDAAAEPIPVAELEAPVGRFNALAWRMVPADSGPAEGASIWMQGTATKDGNTIPFTIQVNEELAFTCGDFVGDERKGILAAGDQADLEATFHFDHLFGDGGAPADDGINTGALGFDPLAALADNGVVDVDSAALQAGLSETDYTTFLGILPSLGHVGEGHCEEVKLTAL
jgi:predicted small lipoprotein YifL